MEQETSMPIFKRESDPPPNQPRPATAAVAQTPFRNDKPAPAAATPAPGASAAGASGGIAPSTQGPAAASASTQARADGKARPAAAVVDEKTEITGNLKSSGNVLIEGRFHGEVEASETVWVEPGAQSDGQLRASDAVISGAVDGEIDCRRRLQIAATAVVKGEIKTPVLVIEDGATVNCRFSMTREGATR
jgi:cytoskeletal protein CcmA (bactofilin family)